MLTAPSNEDCGAPKQNCVCIGRDTSKCRQWTDSGSARRPASLQANTCLEGYGSTGDAPLQVAFYPCAGSRAAGGACRAAKLASQRARALTVAQVGCQHPAQPAGRLAAGLNNDRGPQNCSRILIRFGAASHRHASVVKLQHRIENVVYVLLGDDGCKGDCAHCLALTILQLHGSSRNAALAATPSSMERVYQLHTMPLTRALASFATLSRTLRFSQSGLSHTCMEVADED